MAITVATDEDAFFAFIPDGECPHARHFVEHFFLHDAEKLEYGFGIGIAAEAMSGEEARAQFGMIINFSVVDYYIPAARRPHRLMAEGRQLYNSQATVKEGNFFFVVDATIVGAAMHECLLGLLCKLKALGLVFPDIYSYSTHGVYAAKGKRRNVICQTRTIENVCSIYIILDLVWDVTEK